ncbi:hypothetical protein HIM_04487 [Hirsutella minnesotensis 3608]|uniref:Uncharacterized protein n=1 Tax=Hirsutella minnesotensis 3608 TaxID=1043627 RepID=A0A0F7ZL59_9HYPO|nr:hypothetical protein HIM_04487 [Hirsutella minnesotensis 3608]
MSGPVRLVTSFAMAQALGAGISQPRQNTIRDRCSREKLSDGDEKADLGLVIGPRRSARLSVRAASSVGHIKSTSDNPPRLDVLAELPADGLQRSSTFRVCLEKAVDDINDKYDNPAPAYQPHKQIGDGSDDDMSGATRLTSPKICTNFQPRYRLPKIIHVSTTPLQPDTSEVNEIDLYSAQQGQRTREARSRPSPTDTAHCVDGHQVAVPRGNQGRIHRALSRSRAYSSTSSTKLLEHYAEAERKQELDTDKTVYELEANEVGTSKALDRASAAFQPIYSPPLIELGPSSDELAAVQISIPAASAADNFVPLRVRQPENQARDPSSMATSDSARMRSVSKASKDSTETQSSPLSRNCTSEIHPTTQQRAVSVSELVNKFKRMESPPCQSLRGKDERKNTQVEGLKSKTFDTSRNCVLGGSEDTAMRRKVANADDVTSATVTDGDLTASVALRFSLLPL